MSLKGFESADKEYYVDPKKIKRSRGRDVLHPTLRKNVQPISEALGRARSVGSNLDSITRAVTKKKVGLPKALKRALDNPLTIVADPLKRLTRKRK